MAFKMKGSAFKLNNVATESALKQVSPTTKKEETKQEIYARIIKENNMSKDNVEGRWIATSGPNKGKNINQIISRYPSEQRRHILGTEGKLIEEEKGTPID